VAVVPAPPAAAVLPRQLAAPPVGWPARGAITLRGVQMRYRPDLPLVLAGVDLDVAPGEKVGVIGRTGAGKSSLIVALTRLVEPCAGRIEIDGVDISGLALRDLRSGVTVVSQDTLFFSATLRRNLDPFGEHDDAVLLDALKRVRLLEFARAQVEAGAGGAGGGDAGTALPPPAGGAPTAAAPPSPLDMVIAERGANLSVGQAQLLAVARALLRRPRVLLLDEATASLDVETEAMLNAAVADAFADATVVQIAHRLVSVIDDDRVVVMAGGKVAEAGEPWALLSGAAPGGGARGGSLFAEFVDAMPPEQRDRLRGMAHAAHLRRRARRSEAGV
jgi:ABC-type multidrug transport system fused ATPase/permease subunit